MMIPASVYLILPCATLLHSPGRQSLLLPPAAPLAHPLWSRSSAPAPAKHCDRRRVGVLQSGRRTRGVAGVSPWLLKYIIYTIYETAEDAEVRRGSQRFAEVRRGSQRFAEVRRGSQRFAEVRRGS